MEAKNKASNTTHSGGRSSQIDWYNLTETGQVFILGLQFTSGTPFLDTEPDPRWPNFHKVAALEVCVPLSSSSRPDHPKLVPLNAFFKLWASSFYFCTQAIVEPGDTLYVPPLWYVHP